MRQSTVAPIVDSTTFATRARTIDHLGREQIADCPTAVSELWKNSWDAYARNVRLRIFGEESPVAVLTDDGHGMRKQDLFARWLVIGTESKASDSQPIVPADRNGLAVRSRQGHKGIGRLSSAKLGSVLLLVTKHRTDNYVAALIDWRMFENPYLNLSDVTVATGNFETKEDVFEALPSFTDTLVASVIESTDRWRNREQKVRKPWKRFDDTWLEEHSTHSGSPPSKRVIQGMKNLPFRPDHLGDWEGSGTAMLVFDLDDTLRALLPSGDTDPVKEEVDERFERTLSNFVDPFEIGMNRPDFSYRADIRTVSGEDVHTKVIVGAERSIDRTQVQEMEHQIDGTVGEDGIFRGRLKAFGSWVNDDGKVEFEFPKGITMPERANTRVGAFDIYIASMEFILNNSTHPPSEHNRYVGLAEDYAGLMIYRDGLRVLPYGREDNDFFEIEHKRSKHAGRYFWNHRQIFGRIALTRAQNPNLRDKAGREGFIDNTAGKTFRAIVGNILDLSARRYFGSASNIRKSRLAEIQASNRALRAKEQEKKLRARERKQFLKELEQAEKELPALLNTVELATQSLAIERDLDVSKAAGRLSEWRDKLAETAIRPQPSGTAHLKPRYQAAMVCTASASGAVAAYETKFRDAIDRYNSTKPAQIIADRVKEGIYAVRRQIEFFQTEIERLQREQYGAVKQLASGRISGFRREAEAIGARHSTQRSELADVIDALIRLQNDWADENRNIFGIYLSALETVREQIDLETLASIQVQDLREAATELNRLTALAQLGIAVEIAAHDLADFDDMASTGLNALAEDIRNSDAVRDIRLGLEGLTDQLRFLSPLRLSGDKIQRWIDGAEIETFIKQFFAPTLAKAGIDLRATGAFRALRLYERPARVFPVFVNLVNNSIYWVGTVPRASRQILFDVVGNEVAISDSGPGVSEDDVDQIFNLFFTRKQRSGRGVGLYLARANLAAGGHKIRYRTSEDKLPLSGAAFFINFRGADLGEKQENE